MNALEYYAEPGPMTNINACSSAALDGLPDEPDELMRVVRGCVVSDLMLTRMYDLPVPSGRPDPHIRPAATMIGRILKLDPAPIVRKRRPLDRFLGNCRHFATLSCALFRHRGIPTRVRAGFAAYFLPDTWTDHWIIEYRRPSEDRWVRVDPQYSDAWLEKLHPNQTSESLAQTMYLSGCEAWQRCRSGELDPDRFNMGGDNWGIGEVRGSVLYDLAALNKIEVLPWDTWGQMEAAYQSKTDVTYDELLDHTSFVVLEGDVDAVRALYDSNDNLRVPASMLPEEAA